MAKLLVIDDEEHIRKLYAEVLSREGHQVETAANGDEVFETVEANKYDLIILDIELQNSNGLDLLKRLKTKYPNTAVVLNSAYSIYKSDFSAWLADAYILKSSDITPLKQIVEELVNI